MVNKNVNFIYNVKIKNVDMNMWQKIVNMVKNVKIITVNLTIQMVNK
jgi:hypothetical protein